MNPDEKINNIHSPESLNKELLDSLPIGTLICDSQFNVTFINKGLRQFDITDRSVDLINAKLDPDQKIIQGFPLAGDLESLRNGNPIEREIKQYKRLDGSEISIVLKAVPLAVESEFDGAIVLIEDLTGTFNTMQRPADQSDSVIPTVIDTVWSLFILALPDGRILMTGGNRVSLFRDTSPQSSNSVYSFFTQNISAKVLTSFRGVLVKKQSEELILEIEASGTEDKEYFECMIVPINDAVKKSSLVLISFRAITTFLKMIENYRKENTELQQYFQYASELTSAIIALDAKDHIVFWNKAAEQLFGYRRSEVYGKLIGRIIDAFTPKRLNQIKQTENESQGKEFQETILARGMEEQVIRFRILRQKSSLGKDEWVLFADNITVSQKKEQAQLSLISQFEFFFDTIGVSAFFAENNGRVIKINSQFRKELLYDDEAQGNIYINDIIDNEYSVRADMTLGKLIKNIRTDDVVFRLKNGATHSFTLSLHQFSVSPKEKILVGGLTDTEEKKTLERELHLLKSVFEFTNEGIAIEVDEKYFLVNGTFAIMFGYENPSDLIGVSSINLVADEDSGKANDVRKARKSKKESSTQYEIQLKKKDGSTFFAEVLTAPFTFSGKQFTIEIVRDISERKRTQQAIKESEERYRSIAENIDDFFWMAERNESAMQPIFYTSSVEKMTGYPQNEFLSDKKLFFRIIYPDDQHPTIIKLKKFFQNYYKRSEEIEFRIVNKHGNIVWVRNKINVQRDRKGKIIKAYGLVSDISLQKKAEEEMRQSAIHLQKINETKDRFISIISHDLRTPFSSILGFTDLLLNESGLTPEEAHQYVSYIQESASNILSMVNSLLDWTRIQTGRIQFEPVHCDLSEIAQKVINGLTGVSMQKNISLVNSIEADSMVFVDQSLVIQALNNLYSNALKFTPGGGTVTATVVQSNQPRFLEVHIKDTGVGIKSENLSKIFNVDAKFTTPGTQGEKGTGLGLSLVKEIIEKHSGRIWVESKAGAGTDFIFTLPKASATILLVDDSNTDRILYTKLIKSIVEDYEIISAQNGKEALQKMSTHLPALIITDHEMPVMNGLQFIVEYQRMKIRGKPPVIVLASQLGKSEQFAYSDLGIEYIFSKPVNLASFKSAIEKSLKRIPD